MVVSVLNFTCIFYILLKILTRLIMGVPVTGATGNIWFWTTVGLSVVFSFVENWNLRHYLRKLPNPMIAVADEEEGGWNMGARKEKKNSKSTELSFKVCDLLCLNSTESVSRGSPVMPLVLISTFMSIIHENSFFLPCSVLLSCP